MAGRQAGRQAGGFDMQPLLTVLDAQIDALEAELSRARQARALLAPAGTRAKVVRSAGKVGKRSPVSPGTVEDRVLEIMREAGEPMRMRSLLASDHGAPANAVKKAVAALVVGRHVKAAGSTISRVYALRK